MRCGAVSAILREASDVDPRYGGFLNANLADYVIPVAADLPRIEVAFVGKPDTRFDALGVKTSCASVRQPVQLVRQGFGDGTDAAV